MTNLEKVNGLLEQVKNCPDADIHLYWSPIVQIYIPMPKAERNECADAFYQWALENTTEQSLKFFYAEFFKSADLMLSEKFEQALPLASKAHKSFEEYGDIDGIEMSSLIMGVTYRSLGNFDLALKTLLKPFAYFNQTDRYPIFLEGSCNSLGNVNLELKNYEEAFSIFKTGYEAGLKTGDEYFSIYTLSGMGKAKMLLEEHDEASEYFNRALSDAQKTKSPLHIGNTLNELAIFNFRTGNLAEAEQLNRQALAIREKEKFIGAAVTSCINLGEIYIGQSRWDEALEVLSKGLALAEQIKLKPKLYQVHLLLSKAYKGKGNIEKSLYHHEIFHELREKVQEEDSARKLVDAKLIFESEQTKKENIIIKKQKQEIEMKNIELQETIDELTLARINRKAKAFTLFIAVILFIFEDSILEFALHLFSSENYYLSLGIKIGIIFSLNPVDKGIQHFLLRKVIKRRRMEVVGVSLA